MSREDGGPAFPYESGGLLTGRSGMTLRDYFAANAMQGLIATLPNWSANSIAIKSYEQADAMLAARQEETR